MKRSTFLLSVLFTAMCLLGQLEAVHAAITWTGDTDPANPTTWDNSTWGYVGKTTDGSLMVDGGSDLASYFSYVGYDSGVTGQVTVTGAGSTWANGYRLFVGYGGIGTLGIADGGTVTVAGRMYVAHDPSSVGTVAFGPGGGTLSTGSLCVSPAQLVGTGTIDTRGLVSDVDLVFDTVASLTQTLHFNSEQGQDITLNLDLSDPDDVDVLGVGYGGSGSLSIRDGMTVQSSFSFMGLRSVSMGAATVSGASSTWDNESTLSVGYGGSGTLTITDRGCVSNGAGHIGRSLGSNGEVVVSGADSRWVNRGWLNVGYYGNATVTVTDGGTVSCGSHTHLGYYADSTAEATVTGAGSTWTNDGNGSLYVGSGGSGTLTITDGGTVSNAWGFIGYSLGSTGRVTVSGAGSTWTNRDDLFVGSGDNGTLVITDSGTVISDESTIGRLPDLTGEVTVTGVGSTWTSRTLLVGLFSSAILTIADGGAVSNSSYCHIGERSRGTGTVTVSGVGSTLTNGGSFYVGYNGGSGMLAIIDGGAVRCSQDVTLGGYYSASPGEATISGVGSTWSSHGDFCVGRSGSGTLAISHGGLVSVRGILAIDYRGGTDSFINMAGGGMLALAGDADDSLADFLDLIDGTGSIRYWDNSVLAWADITGATPGVDYTLAYIDDPSDDLYGYTLLTVGVIPEPGTVLMLLIGASMLLVRRRQ